MSKYKINWNRTHVCSLETISKKGVGPTVLVVPGLLADYRYPLFFAERLYGTNPILAFNFEGHSTGDKEVALDEAVISELTFQDELNQLSDIANTINGPYLTMSFSHGFLVDGFAQKEGIIGPIRRIGLSPICSRRDWLEIRNSEFCDDGKVKRFGPYREDRSLDIIKVDFREDTRFDVYQAGKVPVVALHGTKDEFYYGEFGERISSNDIDKLTGGDVKVIKCENEGHVFSLRGCVKAIKEHGNVLTQSSGSPL